MSNELNVIVIMTDQLRADCRKSQGFALDTMPVLDRFAKQGVSFDKAYTTCPVCTPARCSLLTGRYPKATGVRSLDCADQIRMDKDLFQVLQEHGYETALIGKNHSHVHPETLDHYVNYSHWSGPVRDGRKYKDDGNFNQWLKEESLLFNAEATPFKVEQQFPYRLVDDSIDWLKHRKEKKKKPFCLWLSIPEPHAPYQVPEPYFSLFANRKLPKAIPPDKINGKPSIWRFNRELSLFHKPDRDDDLRRYRANYYGMLRLIDDQLKRFFKYLDSSGLKDNTLVVYTSDHGDYVGDFGLWCKGAGLPECLTRIPLIFSGPGIKASLPDAHVSIADVFPTICESLDVEIPKGVQGRSLWPILTGRPFPMEEFASIYAENGVGGAPFLPGEIDWNAWPQLLGDPETSTFTSELNSVTQSGHRKMIRKGKWKLVYDLYWECELYNLEEDPNELKNRWNNPKYRVARQELVEELVKWNIRLEDPLPINRWPMKRTEHLWNFQREC